MPRKASVELGADFSEMGFTMGLISGMAKTVKTDRYLGDVISYVHGEMSEAFDEHMDFVYGAMPSRFSHVYEWDARQSANPVDLRLWDHKLLGSGGSRNATFVWKASVKPIPTPAERKAANNPNDPINQVPDEEIAKLSNRNYIFYWKAPIMEYNVPVNIRPKYAKALFIPTGDPVNPFVFANEFRNLTPGGTENTGAFTAEWVQWWGAMAQDEFEKHLRPALEDDLGDVVRQGQRVRGGKKVSLSATKSYDASFESGEAWAEAYINKYSKEYKARNKK